MKRAVYNEKGLTLNCSECGRSERFYARKAKDILAAIGRSGWHEGPNTDVCRRCKEKQDHPDKGDRHPWQTDEYDKRIWEGSKMSL